MKKVLIVGMGCCMVLAGAMSAQAVENQQDEFYVSGNLGINFNTGTDVGDIEFDEGWQVSFAAGNRIQEHIRIEGEYQYLDTDNTVKVDSLMANVYYDFHNWNGWTPYVTTGIGIGWFDYTDSHVTGSDHSFVWKLGAGVDYDLTDNMKLGVRYTYMDAIDDIDWDSNLVGAVLTYKF